jgi:hypothetical protein
LQFANFGARRVRAIMPAEPASFSHAHQALQLRIETEFEPAQLV